MSSVRQEVGCEFSQGNVYSVLWLNVPREYALQLSLGGDRFRLAPKFTEVSAWSTVAVSAARLHLPSAVVASHCPLSFSLGLAWRICYRLLGLSYASRLLPSGRLGHLGLDVDSAKKTTAGDSKGPSMRGVRLRTLRRCLRVVVYRR